MLRSHFSGLPKRENLEIVEEELPALKDGGTFTAVSVFFFTDMHGDLFSKGWSHIMPAVLTPVTGIRAIFGP